MPTERVYEILFWNYAEGKMRMETVYACAFRFDEVLAEAQNYVKGQKRTLMGVKMLGDIMFKVI